MNWLEKMLTEKEIEDAPLPWEPLEMPPLSTFNTDNVSLELENIPLIRGYFQGMQAGINNWVLKKDGELWMSLTPMELESHMPHCNAATGHTVIVGAGLGLILFNVLKKESVTMVTLIENDQSILKMLEEQGMNSWEGIEKLDIVAEDVFELGEDEIVNVDFLYVDIWPILGADEAFVDTQKIHKNIKAKSVGYWGMELDFILWCKQTSRQPYFLKTEDYIAWVADSRMPLIGIDFDDMHRFCIAAAENVIQY